MGSYDDDPTILDEDTLWRRIPHWHFVVDENIGGVRPSSAAFADDAETGDPMSVVLGDEVLEAHRRPEDILAGLEGFAMVAFSTGFARSQKQAVARDPTPSEPAHALVVGKKTGSVRKAFAKNCEWVIPPPPEYMPK